MNINELRKIALDKKEELKSKGEALEKIDTIIAFLNDDMCFFKVSINISVPVLLYLGIPEEEVKNVYFELMDVKNYKKEYNVRNCIGK